MNNNIFSHSNFTHRTNTKQLKYQNVLIGGQNKIVIQSMTNTKTCNIQETIKQIKKLAKLGCELVRVAVFDQDDANALSELVKLSPLPIVADIHFNYLFAIIAIQAKCAGIRINPGNIHDPAHLKRILAEANENNVNIRIGINSGSLPKHIIEKYGHSEIALYQAIKEFVDFFEKNNFYKIILSVKSTDPLITLKANYLLAQNFSYPIHLGVTEAGTEIDASIKSSIGLGPLLMMGIGDTIRISITGDPCKEIPIAKSILSTTELYKNVVNVISCPTCGRLDFNMEQLVKKVKNYTKNMHFPLTISILGCVVNGIGEGAMADIGVAGSKHKGLLFVKGKIIKEVKEEELFNELKKEINKAYKLFKKENK